MAGRPTVAGGEIYPSAYAAQKALGITGSALSSRIYFGWPGFFNVAEGQRPDIRKTKANHLRPGHQCVGQGRQFINVRAAVEALGIPEALFRSRVRHGIPGYFFVNEGQRPLIPFKRRPNGPVVIGDLTFTNPAAAAAAWGNKSRQAVLYRIAHGFPGWRFANAEQRPYTAPSPAPAWGDFTRKYGPAGLPVVIDGTEYANRRAAMAALNKTEPQIDHALKKARLAAQVAAKAA